MSQVVMGIQMLRRWWLRWTEPVAATLSEEALEQARLVAGMSLMIWLISFAGFVLTLPLSLASGTFAVVAIFVAILAFGLPYLMARYGRPRAAILTNCVWATITIFAASAIAGGELARNGLYYLVTVCIYAATFLSVRTAALLALSCSAAVLVLGPSITAQPIEQVIGGAFSFNLVGAGFTLLFVYYWRLREARKRDALSKSEARYRAISEHVSDYMFYARFTDDGGRVVEWETEQYTAVTGYEKQEWNPNFLVDRMPPEDRTKVVEGRKRVRQGEYTQDEARLLRKDGSEAWVRIERIPVMDENLRCAVGYYGIIVDITEHRRARDHELELSMRRAQFNILETFVRAISHDFRNRLSAIETTRYLISKQVSDEDLARIQPRLDQISTQTSDMITQLTNLTLIHALNSPRFERTDLNTICESLSANFADQAKAKGLEFQLDLVESSPQVDVDIEHLGQALTHLMTNALTHTLQGCVILRTRCEHAQGVVEVEDTGAGIPEDKLQHIFEPFFRADEARTVTKSGIGLGLTLVKLVIEAHLGTIEVASTVGSGTRFTIRLPAVPR